MNIGQCDFDMFEVTVAKLYEAYRTADSRGWIESLLTDQPTPTQVKDAWSTYRKALVYSPVVDDPCLSQTARDQLAALVAIERAALNAGFSFDGTNIVFRALADSILRNYGVSDKALTTLRVLHAVLVGPEEYLKVFGHYPVHEKSFCLSYAQDADAAMQRHH